ncbi:MAG: hypothetical protein HKN76_07225 [Saprospiraceae bacterium]|nr:hypothetical protein [Saprospiraceae bacterium]
MSEKISRKELLELLNNPKENAELRNALDDVDKKALEGYQYLADGTANEAIDSLSKRFDQWLPNQEISRSTRTINTSRRRWILRVAAAALLFLIPVFFLLKSPSSARMASQYFEAPRSPYLNMNRGAQDEIDKEFYDAFALYEKKQYLEASEALAELSASYPDKLDLPFYQAVSLLGANQVDAAIDILKVTATQNYQDLDRRSPWFLGLAFLMKSDENEAKVWLQKAVELDEQYGTDAASLLEKMR